MPWPENLTTAQQAFITAYFDQVFRPACLQFVKTLSACNDQVIPGALASPSGATSTFQSPAADSVMGMLAALSGSDIIPLSTANPTGLALAQPVSVTQAISFITALDGLIGTYWQLANQEAFSLIVGAPNV